MRAFLPPELVRDIQHKRKQMFLDRCAHLEDVLDLRYHKNGYKYDTGWTCMLTLWFTRVRAYHVFCHHINDEKTSHEVQVVDWVSGEIDEMYHLLGNEWREMDPKLHSELDPFREDA